MTAGDTVGGMRNDRPEIVPAPAPRRARVLPLVLEVALIVLPLAAAASACGGDDSPTPVDGGTDTPVDTPVI